MKHLIRYPLDRLALGLSFTCAAHCALLPLVVAFAPLFGLTLSESPELHKWIVSLTFLVSLLAMRSGYIQHRRGYPFGMALLGCLLLGLAAFARHEILGELQETFLMVTGSMVVAIAHLTNLRCLPSEIA